MTPKQIQLAKQAGFKDYYGCKLRHDVKDARIAELEEALELAKSVCNSVNKSSRHEIKVDGERYFIQTDEWVSWVSHEVLDKIIDALKK